MTLAETHLRAGEHAAAARHAQDAVRTDPYRERGWQILMQIAAAVGDHDAVIGAYRECRASLAGVGIEPSPATQALVDSLRSGLDVARCGSVNAASANVPRVRQPGCRGERAACPTPR